MWEKRIKIENIFLLRHIASDANFINELLVGFDTN